MDLISGMRVFVSIADNGSLAKAGRELDLSPSVVSLNTYLLWKTDLEQDYSIELLDLSH